jgi:DNA gyrase/topoisomerase IV subunit A
MATDGYRRTKPGAKGVRTMKLDEEHDDSIISVRTIPDIEDHLFLLTKSGMMIRIRVSQTKETSGKSTRGTRVMELRNKKKGGFTDEIIFSSRVSASLLDVDDEEEESSLGEEAKRSLRLCSFGLKSLKRRIETGWHRLRPAGGFHLSGEIDGRAFFDL